MKVLFIVFSMFVFSGHASVVVKTNETHYMVSSGGDVSIEISNRGNEHAFIILKLEEFVGAGKNTELKEVGVIDSSLLISEKKMILAPNQKQVLHAMNRGGDEDRFYLLTPVIVTAEQYGQTSINSNKEGVTEGSVAVNLSYASVVLALRTDPIVDFKMQQDGNSTSVINSGNSVMWLENVSVCSNAFKLNCNNFRGRQFIYPGQTVDLGLDGADLGDSIVTLVTGGNERIVVK